MRMYLEMEEKEKQRERERHEGSIFGPGGPPKDPWKEAQKKVGRMDAMGSFCFSFVVRFFGHACGWTSR